MASRCFQVRRDPNGAWCALPAPPPPPPEYPVVSHAVLSLDDISRVLEETHRAGRPFTGTWGAFQVPPEVLGLGALHDAPCAGPLPAPPTSHATHMACRSPLSHQIGGFDLVLEAAPGMGGIANEGHETFDYFPCTAPTQDLANPRGFSSTAFYPSGMDMAAGHAALPVHPAAKASDKQPQAGIGHGPLAERNLSHHTSSEGHPSHTVHQVRPCPDPAQLDHPMECGNPGTLHPRSGDAYRDQRPGGLARVQHPAGPLPATGGVFSFASGRSAPKTTLSAARLKELFGGDLDVGHEHPTGPAWLPSNPAQPSADGSNCGRSGATGLGPNPRSLPSSACRDGQRDACVEPESGRGRGSVPPHVSPQGEEARGQGHPNQNGMGAEGGGLSPVVLPNSEGMGPSGARAGPVLQPCGTIMRPGASNLGPGLQPAAEGNDTLAATGSPAGEPLPNHIRGKGTGTRPAVPPGPESRKAQGTRPGAACAEQATGRGCGRGVAAFKAVVPVDRGQPLLQRASGVGKKMARGGPLGRGSAQLPPFKRVCKDRLQSLFADIMADATGVNDSELLAGTVPGKPVDSGNFSGFQKPNASHPPSVGVPGQCRSGFPPAAHPPAQKQTFSRPQPEPRWTPRPSRGAPGTAHGLPPAAPQEPQPHGKAPIIPQEPAWQLGPSSLGVFANCTSESQSGEGLTLALDAVEGIEQPSVELRMHSALQQQLEGPIAWQTNAAFPDQPSSLPNPHPRVDSLALPPLQQECCSSDADGGRSSTAGPWRTDDSTNFCSRVLEGGAISQQMVNGSTAVATDQCLAGNGIGRTLETSSLHGQLHGQGSSGPGCAVISGTRVALHEGATAADPPPDQGEGQSHQPLEAPAAWEPSESSSQQLAPCGWTLGGNKAAPLASAEAQASAKALLQEPHTLSPRVGPPVCQLTNQHISLPEGGNAAAQHGEDPQRVNNQPEGENRWDSQDDGTVAEAACGWTCGGGKAVPLASHEAQQRARGVLLHAAGSPEQSEGRARNGQARIGNCGGTSAQVMEPGQAERQVIHAGSTSNATPDPVAQLGAPKARQPSPVNSPGFLGRTPGTGRGARLTERRMSGLLRPRSPYGVSSRGFKTPSRLPRFVSPVSKGTVQKTLKPSRLGPGGERRPVSTFSYNVQQSLLKSILGRLLHNSQDPATSLQKLVVSSASRVPSAVEVPASEGIGKEGTVLGPPDFASLLYSAGADEALAPLPWVANHLRWILWKLKGYVDRHPDQLSGHLLNAPVILDQLKYRYEVEINQGRRSLLKKVLEQDEPAARMMVLSITQTDHGLGEDTPAGAPRWVLTDGWYGVMAELDADLQLLAQQGKLKPGDKLRIFGATLSANPAEDAYIACQTSILKLHYNGTHRADSSTRLGWPAMPYAIVSLPMVLSGGGMVPATLVFVQRKYPGFLCSRGEGSSMQLRTPGAAYPASPQSEAQMDKVEDKIEQQLEAEELQRCKDLLRKPIYSEDRGETAYARFLLAGEGGTCDLTAEEHGLISSARLQHEARMELRRQQLRHQYASGPGNSGRERSEKISRHVDLLVSAVLHKGQGAHNAQAIAFEAIIRLHVHDDDDADMVEEGKLYLITNLIPNPRYHNTLKLDSYARRSKWRCLDAAALDRVLVWRARPRIMPALCNLECVKMDGDFDFQGVLVWAGTMGGDDIPVQWLFLVDEDTLAAIVDPHNTPWLLAVELKGQPQAMHFFEPGTKAAGSKLALRDLRMDTCNKNHCLWNAKASENSAIKIIQDARPQQYLSPTSPSTNMLMYQNRVKTVLGIPCENEPGLCNA